MKKYIGIIFIVASFMGVFHHHNDVMQHNDCQICTVQSSIANADTPSDVLYLSELELFSEATLSDLPQFFLKKRTLELRARAPPLSL